MGLRSEQIELTCAAVLCYCIGRKKNNLNILLSFLRWRLGSLWRALPRPRSAPTRGAHSCSWTTGSLSSSWRPSVASGPSPTRLTSAPTSRPSTFRRVSWRSGCRAIPSTVPRSWWPWLIRWPIVITRRGRSSMRSSAIFQ